MLCFFYDWQPCETEWLLALRRPEPAARKKQGNIVPLARQLPLPDLSATGSWEQAGIASGGPRAKLEHILDAVYRQREGLNPHLFQLLQQDRELHTVLFAKREQLGDRLGRLMRHLRAILEEGKAQGAFDPTISMELMLTLVMNLISFSRRPPIPLPEPAQRSPEELLAQAKRVLFDGIATHPGGEQRS